MTIAAAPQRRRRLTKEELQQELKASILESIRKSHVEVAESGLSTVDNWARKGADRLATDQSDASFQLAGTNAERCGKAIGEAARATPDRTATRDLILAVFNKICPIYPFC